MEGLEISRVQEQEGLFHALENTDICTFWYYPQKKLITIDDRTAQMYGCKNVYPDMPTSFAEDFVHPSTRAVFCEMYYRIDRGDRTAQASFSSQDRRNWCTVTLTTVAYDEQGRPEKTYGIIQNISDLKLQEAEYHSNSMRLINIISALSKIYMFNYFIDLQTGTFMEIVGLDYITKVLGTEGDVVSAFRLFCDTLIEQNSRAEFEAFVDVSTLAERIGSQQNISLEYLSIKQGWCRSNFIVVKRDDSGRAIQVEFVVENISAQREKELEDKEALEKAYAEANKANASKSAFLNNMSHDIRTPMNAIVGFSAIAASHIEDQERVRDCIDKITASSKHLLSIINEVLDMSRIESGKIELQEQEANLPTILHDFMNMIQEQVRIKGLALSIDTMNLSHENVYADEGRIHRILLNLVGNAIKFTPVGGSIFIRLAEKPQTSPKYGNYVISVRDTGIGMSEEFLPHVFEAFERERTSTISKMEGTGLGMAITKNIIEIMGGTIQAESRQGEGSVFTVELPLKLIEKRLENPRIERLAGLHAMVIDDDYNVCDSVSKMLDKIGMEPEWIMSGKEALLHTKLALEMGRSFSAFFVDWKMPDIRGVEVVRQLRVLVGPKVPIFILTAYDFSDIEQEAVEAGMTGFCQKPLFLSKLRRVLLEAFGEGEEEEVVLDESWKEGLKGKHILLVEDNELNQEIAEEILSEVGFEVDTAENGRIAVEKLAKAEEGTYDLVLMDIQMPVMDGYEATRTIRAMEAPWILRLPILAMTANAFEEDKKKAMEAGMNGHLSKPIDTEKLFQTLSEILIS
ncbi:MAG: response regulator [Lachnospiraceae bacterium]|nr:response regulator [Lachnospiraceae bacterium]